MSAKLAPNESPRTEGCIAHGHILLIADLPKLYHTFAKFMGANCFKGIFSFLAL